MSEVENLRKDAKTVPNVAPISNMALSFIRDPDDKLIVKYLLDSEMNFRIRHPAVIIALLEMVKPKLLPILRKYEEEEAEAKKEKKAK